MYLGMYIYFLSIRVTDIFLVPGKTLRTLAVLVN